MSTKHGRGGARRTVGALLGLALAALFLAGSTLDACTVFLIGDGETVLAGNNEDYSNPFTHLWFVPAEEGKLGRVCFGFDNGMAQGGMNEKGLFFDGLATAPLPVKKSLDRPRYEGNLLDGVLAECASVEEALAMLGRYSLKGWERFQIFLGDASGDAAIVEGDEVIRKKDRHLACTNFHQSRMKEAGVTCNRYRIATSMLSSAGEIDVALCRSVLAAVHQEGANPTQYSNVYDLKRGIVYLYHFHNFENVVALDLKEELKKGARRIEIASLFPRTHAAETFREAAVKRLQERRQALEGASVPAEALDRCTGTYRLETGQAFGLFRSGDALFLRTEGGRAHELIPRGDFRFVVLTFEGEFEVSFEMDAEGRAVALVLKVRGESHRAVRAE